MTTRRPPSRSSRAPARPGSARGANPRRRSFVWRWRRALFVAGLLIFGGASGFAVVLLNIELPPEEVLRQTTFVCSAEVNEDCGPDEAFASFSAEEDRINVPLEAVPDVVVEAVLATEDRDFFEHSGVDPVGIARALYQDLRGQGVQQGGSTITQQYVKTVYLSAERTITRKVKEAVLAVKLERELDKEEILERYLNTIYFGRGAYGVGAASRAYFGTGVRQLGLVEASYLAGLIRAPESADALAEPEEATRRRRTVLDAMVEEGYITREAADVADEVPWESVVVPRRDRTGLGPVRGREIGTDYFAAHIRDLLLDRYGDDVVYGGGLRVYTTLDFDMQRAAWEAVTSTLDEPDDPAAALVAVDDRGGIRAMVGGTDYSRSEVNLALGRAGGGSGRGPGSAFKPFVLAEAVRQGISLQSKFNAPGVMTFPRADAGKDWRVGNYGGTEQGVLDLIQATRTSSNTAYVQLMLEVGPEAVADLANRMGITAELPPANSLVLGTGDVSVLDMASAYSTFANRGVQREPVAIARIEQVDEDGNVTVLHQHEVRDTEVLTANEADLVTYCLRQVVLGGTGRSASFGQPAAGKTGTTNDNRDAWFVGYTPRLTAAVWMGYPGEPGDEETRVMDDVHGREVTGGSFPADIWREFMRDATRGIDNPGFPGPTSFPGRVLNRDLQTTTSTESTTTSETTTTTTEPTTTTDEEPETTETTEPTSSTATSETTTPTSDPPDPPDPPDP